METRIQILGKFEATRPARATIGPALEHSAASLEISVHYEWMNSRDLDPKEIESAHGIFIAPGSPFEESQNIIEAIKLAREKGIPCIGTCGGFQRMVAEYAQNVLAYGQITHQEVEPDSTDPLFSELSCSLAGKDSDVFILPDTLASSVYGALEANERFFCSFGLNRRHQSNIESRDLKVSGIDRNGEARIIEHTKHPFFVGTLFVPQARSKPSSPHPAITAFLRSSRYRLSPFPNKPTSDWASGFSEMG